MQTSRTLALAMFAYTNDNNGQYPFGKSSTEAFQKLLDGGYVNDPAIFYIPMSGKTKAVSGQPLKPENVCYDVTVLADDSSPEELPLVFSTGYRMNYVPGGSAVPLIKPYPLYDDQRDWLQRLLNDPPSEGSVGIAIGYKSNRAAFKRFEILPKPDGVIPNIVSPHFDAHGKTYRQLTPNGSLP
jgi:hypothetical protein